MASTSAWTKRFGMYSHARLLCMQTFLPRDAAHLWVTFFVVYAKSIDLLYTRQCVHSWISQGEKMCTIFLSFYTNKRKKWCIWNIKKHENINTFKSHFVSEISRQSLREKPSPYLNTRMNRKHRNIKLSWLCPSTSLRWIFLINFRETRGNADLPRRRKKKIRQREIMTFTNSMKPKGRRKLNSKDFYSLRDEIKTLIKLRIWANCTYM